ncbi:MAG: hypothetical protein JWM72_1609 [Actinomycetia bacterium]|nr:hypothetical protein [Actinomycetes bacterium]
MIGAGFSATLVAAKTTPSTTVPRFILTLPPSHSSTHWAAIFGVLFAALTAILAGLAAWGARFAGVQVREARIARLQAASADLSEKWGAPALEEARRLVGDYATPADLAVAFAEASEANGENYYVLVREPNFFEDLAVSLELGSLDFELIQKALGSVVVTRWLQWRNAIEWLRGDEADAIAPQNDLAFSEFEALARRMAHELGMPLPEN